MLFEESVGALPVTASWTIRSRCNNGRDGRRETASKFEIWEQQATVIENPTQHRGQIPPKQLVVVRECRERRFRKKKAGELRRNVNAGGSATNTNERQRVFEDAPKSKPAKPRLKKNNPAEERW